MFLFMYLLMASSELRHENLVRLFGICVSPLSMVIEWCPGQTLHHFLREGTNGYAQPSEALILRIGLDIARGLAHLHVQTPPIVHRDLRSPNIFVRSLLL